MTREHYDRLAATYDENWAYSPAVLEWMTRLHLKAAATRRRDVVADIGCGTGLYARGLARHAAAVLVHRRASEAMLAQVSGGDGVTTLVARAKKRCG